MSERETPDALRVLVLAPTAADAALSESILREAGLACTVHRDLAALREDIDEVTGVILLTEEAVTGTRIDVLVDALRGQPPWSDIQVLLLCGSGADSAAAPRAMGLLGNVTILERPVRTTTLVSVLRAALRARRRQLELRDQMAALVRTQEQLREADRRKDEFLATLAHELRNPLAPIRNALHVLRLGGDQPAVLEHMRAMMERQINQMVRLIDDLLDVSRITRGTIALRRERVELASVVKDALDSARPFIEGAGHALSVSLPPEPLLLDADPVRLTQAIVNLLNNAGKYTEPGGQIWVSTLRQGDDVVICVRDTGIGMPKEALPTIFGLFSQVDRSSERSRGGLGIGLTLVKRLVELHGGTVIAHSDGPGEGSEFRVRLPLAADPSRAEMADDEPGEPLDVAPTCRILVADDNPDVAESMSTLLRLMGNEVRIVHDGLQAVEAAATFRPDLIILDIGMPGMDGYETARRIRQQDWGSHPFLVALTGWGQEEDRRRAREAGFDRHLTKPAEPDALIRLVTALRTERGSGVVSNASSSF